MSFLVKDDEVWEKREDIWHLIENKLGIKFHISPGYDEKYIKAKVREFEGKIKTNFSMECQKKIYIILALIVLLLILLWELIKKSSRNLCRRVYI